MASRIKGRSKDGSRLNQLRFWRRASSQADYADFRLSDRELAEINDRTPLIDGEPSPHEYFYYSTLAVRSREWKYLDGELYNLIDDISETTDLSGEHPEIANELQTALDALQDDIALNRRPLAHLDDFSEEEKEPRDMPWPPIAWGP